MNRLELLKKLNGEKIRDGYYHVGGFYIVKMPDGQWRTRMSGQAIVVHYHDTLTAALQYVDSKEN